MNPDMISTWGTVIIALLGGGMIKALADYIRNRQVGSLENRQFDFTTLKELNDLLRVDLNGVRVELEEERVRRRNLEEELATERRLRRALEARVADLERNTGGTNG